MDEFILYAGILYLIIINLTELILMGNDKGRAQDHRWRIPEKTLLLVAAAGGSFGGYAGMKLFHHKTRKAKFWFTLPVLMVAHVVVVSLLVNKMF